MVAGREAVVTGLFIYPVKSCAGTELAQADLGPRGIMHDREYMLVDRNARFLTQRELPRLALIRPLLLEDGLQLTAETMPRHRLRATEAGPRLDVTVWRDTVAAVDQGDAVADWLSAFLNASVRLVRLPSDSVRLVDPAYAPRPIDQVGFADGYPLLLIAEESLADLNRRLAIPLPMNRFRPNVVVRGWGRPYAEDEWAELRIGSVPFEGVKACARCAITTVDQATAARGNEPLATLAGYRWIERGLLFGQNLVHASEGRIRVGDRLTVQRFVAAPLVGSALAQS
jgi:uncharacterized protein YcbX